MSSSGETTEEKRRFLTAVVLAISLPASVAPFDNGALGLDTVKPVAGALLPGL